ncbi:hypothetical protein [Streptomyces sp. NPDC001568]|uniref:hypothetical protein n=1 Tax=Streptomyces sp. NPDC001568 TaxID=3364588 RepID=UPI0036BB98B7
MDVKSISLLDLLFPSVSGIAVVTVEPTAEVIRIEAGMTSHWNSGPVEGAVNRIKMLKRQMFGRADFPLLHKRVLLA